jgi:hypothetical protein
VGQRSKKNKKKHNKSKAAKKSRRRGLKKKSAKRGKRKRSNKRGKNNRKGKKRGKKNKKGKKRGKKNKKGKKRGKSKLSAEQRAAKKKQVQAENESRRKAKLERDEQYRKSLTDYDAEKDKGKGEEVEHFAADMEGPRPDAPAPPSANTSDANGSPGRQKMASLLGGGKWDFNQVKSASTHPDFWDPANQADRKAIRRRLQKSKNPEERALAQQLLSREGMYHQARTGETKGAQAQDSASTVRMTDEKMLAQYGSDSPRALRGVTNLKDVGGNLHSGYGNALGLEAGYLNEIKNRGQVAVISKGTTEKVRADSAGMAKMYMQAKHENKILGNNEAQVKSNIEVALSYPAAPVLKDSAGKVKTGADGLPLLDEAAVTARPDLYHSVEVQRHKLELDKRMGANSQKTADGNTLTAAAHEASEQKFKSKMDDIHSALQGGTISQSEADRQRDAARQERANRKGDSFKGELGMTRSHVHSQVSLLSFLILSSCVYICIVWCTIPCAMHMPHTEYYDVRKNQPSDDIVGAGQKLADQDEFSVVMRLPQQAAPSPLPAGAPPPSAGV